MIALGADSQLKQLRGLCGGSRRAAEGAEPPQGVLQAKGRHAIEAAHPAFEPTVVRVHVFPINPFTQAKLGACVFAGFLLAEPLADPVALARPGRGTDARQQHRPDRRTGKCPPGGQ